MTKKEAEKAYQAGAALRRADPTSLPDGAKSDPVGSCPFPVGDPQRTEWLRGFQEAHEEERVPDLSQQLDDAIGVASRASS